MLLMNYYMDCEGKRVYTLKNQSPDGKKALPAHPARFSPADPYSGQRITIKRRYGLLLTQQPPIKY